MTELAPATYISPEAANRARTQAEAAEQHRLIESQLNTEELVAGLGAVGIGRLRHPFKTARILLVASRRQAKGQYDPRLAGSTANNLSDPFNDDPLQDARSLRRWQAHKAQKRAKLQAAEEARGPYQNPFIDQDNAQASAYAGKTDSVPRQLSSTNRNPFEF